MLLTFKLKVLIPQESPCHICGDKKKSKFSVSVIGTLPIKYQACISCGNLTFFLDLDPSSRKEISPEDVPPEVKAKLGIP